MHLARVTLDLDQPEFSLSALEQLVGERFSLGSDKEIISGSWQPQVSLATSALQNDEVSVCGQDVKNRLKHRKLLGARAFRYYWNRQVDIPTEWQRYLVFFDATEFLLSKKGPACTLYLGKSQDAWYCSWSSLARPRKIHRRTAVMRHQSLWAKVQHVTAGVKLV